MKFAHISDLHLCQNPGETAAIPSDVSNIVKGVAAQLGNIASLLDFIIVSGDLTEDGDPRSYAEFEQIFKPLNLPVYVVPGNHDGPSSFFENKRTSSFFQASDISGRVLDLGPVRLLGVNSAIDSCMTGRLSEDDLALIETELGSGVDSQLVIVMHHPPFEPGLKDFNDISVVEGSDRLAQLLREAEVPPIIVCGHVHRPYFSMWNGANCFIGGSPAVRFGAELPFGEQPVRPTNESYSYFVHSLGAQGHHVVTPTSVSKSELMSSLFSDGNGTKNL